MLVGATDVLSVDCSGFLDAGETVTGTPTVVEVGSAQLTITNVQINGSAITIQGVSVPASHAVTFTADATSSAKGIYTLRINIPTTAGVTPGGLVKLQVK